MKFTSEDLMKAMGLQVGDRVKVVICDNDDKNTIFEITKNETCGGLTLVDINEGFFTDLEFLLDQDFEILPRPKRVGDLKCSDDDTLNCSKCPLFVLCHASRMYDNKRLYDVLDNWFKSSNDQEIYDLLKARLDKEVV